MKKAAKRGFYSTKKRSGRPKSSRQASESERGRGEERSKKAASAPRETRKRRKTTAAREKPRLHRRWCKWESSAARGLLP